MRIIGIDLGERRIGVAVGDDRVSVVVPSETVEVAGDVVDVVVRIAEEQRADELVIGLPLSLTGALGPQAEQVVAVVEELRRRLSIPVNTWDERLTTTQAARMGAPRSRKGRPSGVDAAAAAIMLQACLDARRSPA